MGAVFALPTAATPIERVLLQFDRPQIEGFIEVAIRLLDLADGDPDLGPNGDELDGHMGEDDFHLQSEGGLSAAGCPVSDPGEDDTQDVCEAGDHGGGFVVLGGRSGWGADHDDADNENWRQPATLNQEEE